MKYICAKRFQGKAIAGGMTIAKNTRLDLLDDGFLYKGTDKVCYKASQNAFDFFARNDDDHGLDRFKVAHEIIDIIKGYKADYADACAQALAKLTIPEEATEEEIAQAQALALEGIEDKAGQAFDLINADETFKHYLHNGIWGFEFFNAELADLERLKEAI